MKRRDFIYTSGLATVASVLGSGCAGMRQKMSGDSASSPARQYLELRRYEFSSAKKREAFDGFLAKAAIPALIRLGISPVGVFKAAEGENTDLYVLLPHLSLESVSTVNAKLLADPAYLEAGDAVLNCPKKDPAYQRVVSSLLLAFDQCPCVEVPSTKDSRVFQLRIYESHNTLKGQRKIEMFNKGEIDLFRRTGLNPVFFGEALVGEKMPNLTYMVGFDDTAAQKAAWGTFGKHPEWKKMSSDPYYKDTVSNITNLVLKPTMASQI